MVRDLEGEAEIRGLSLVACVASAQGAFGLAADALLYVGPASGSEPGAPPHVQMVAPLQLIESVEADSAGHVIIRGSLSSDATPSPPDVTPDVVSSSSDVIRKSGVLVRGCSMAAFEVESLAAFFEAVQAAVD
ncbi:hypothetical protein T484DRAFT_1882357 [Baffinella frigidus]|nr:hypothetical protein T484DRAFT_1882357 [Cryptophyta sp. CCMP2293]